MLKIPAYKKINENLDGRIMISKSRMIQISICNNHVFDILKACKCCVYELKINVLFVFKWQLLQFNIFCINDESNMSVKMYWFFMGSIL